MRKLLKRLVWLSGVVILVAGLMLEWPFLREQAVATEVTIDDSIQTGSESNNTPGTSVVFTGDQTGYSFYVDSAGDCVYRKTTDAGASWGSPVTFHDESSDDCLMPTVWYDRWTPGDTTGEFIHIVTKDPNTDDLWYNRLDISDDSLLLASSVAVSTDESNTMGSATNTNTYPAITKGTDGDLYVGVEDDTSSYTLKCTSSCDSASSWSITEATWTTGTSQNNPLVLLPLAGGDIMAIHHNAAANDVEYQTYDDGTDDWSNESAAWTDIDASADEPAGFSTCFGVAVDPLTNDVYLAFIDINTAVTTNDDEIRTYTYSGSWTAAGDVLDDAGAGGENTRPTQVKVSFNVNNEDLYAAYVKETTSGTVTSGNIYYKVSTDGMSSWGSESSAITSASDQYHSLATNFSSKERMYVVWKDETDDDLRGETLANIGTTYSDRAYRWFANANSTDVGSALATQDTAYTLTSTGEEFRLRMLLLVGGDGARVNLDSFKLQFAAKSGSCDTAYSGETYADVTTSTAISYKDNATPTDGSNLTGNANDPTDGGATIRNQTYEEANNFTNSNLVIAATEDGKWDFALYDNGAPSSTSYCFRVVLSDGTLVATPTVVPEIVTAAGGDPCTSSTTDQQMRHGNIFSSSTEQKFCWVN